MQPNPPVRPLLPPGRKPFSLLAEIVGGIATPVLFVGMLISIRYTFSGPDWECSGSGCLAEFDRLRGWTFPIPLFAMMFITTFGFVAALLLYLWGRSGRPPSFDETQAHARPALTGVAKRLVWVGVLELSLGAAFYLAGLDFVAWILGGVGVVLLLIARGAHSSATSANRVLATGVPATAEITDVQPTGTVMNGNPLMKLTLTIIQDGVPLFPVVHKEYIPTGHMGKLQVGARLPVKVDPLDSNSLAIEWDKQPVA